jgi:multidrug transporter EmrE-like cation transporter
MVSRRILIAHGLIIGTILFTVYGQLIIKWQVQRLPPDVSADPSRFLVAIVLNPWIVSGLASAFVAFVFWAAAMRDLQLSYAYPFTSLSFVFVALLSWRIFGESLTQYQVIGLAIVLLGLFISTRR